MPSGSLASESSTRAPEHVDVGARGVEGGVDQRLRRRGVLRPDREGRGGWCTRAGVDRVPDQGVEPHGARARQVAPRREDGPELGREAHVARGLRLAGLDGRQRRVERPDRAQALGQEQVEPRAPRLDRKGRREAPLGLARPPEREKQGRERLDELDVPGRVFSRALEGAGGGCRELRVAARAERRLESEGREALGRGYRASGASPMARPRCAITRRADRAGPRAPGRAKAHRSARRTLSSESHSSSRSVPSGPEVARAREPVGPGQARPERLEPRRPATPPRRSRRGARRPDRASARRGDRRRAGAALPGPALGGSERAAGHDHVDDAGRVAAEREGRSKQPARRRPRPRRGGASLLSFFFRAWSCAMANDSPS